MTIDSSLSLQGLIRLLADKRSHSLDPYRDAQRLLEHVLGRSRAWLLAHSDYRLKTHEFKALEAIHDSFSRGTPLAYLCGEQEFWSLPFHVNSHTLIPRPETEDCLEWFLRSMPHSPACRVVDLGTGSGIIACVLKHARPNWDIVATDLSQEALSVARFNARELGLNIEFCHGNWCEAVSGQLFDCVVSNPPYIRQGDPHLDALQYEPRSALVGGVSGLEAIEAILSGVHRILKIGGLCLIEHGCDQQEQVIACFQQHGFERVEGYSDLSHQPRFVVGWRAK